MRIDGDLVPFTSGTVSLGIDSGPVAQLFHLNTLAPLNHVHQLSGVFHDPLYGQSGVLRFNLEQSAFEVSVNGGRTFSKVRTLDVDLQEAYNNGNEIDLNTINTKYKGVLVKELDRNTAVQGPVAKTSDLINEQNLNYGIAVSGFTDDVNNPHSFSFSRLTSNALVITGSGMSEPIAGTDSKISTSLFIGYDPTIEDEVFNEDTIPALIITSGALAMQTARRVDTINGNFTIFVPDSEAFDSHNITFNLNGITQIRGGRVKHLNDTLLQGRNQLTLQAFGTSGQLQYRPHALHEAWHWKPSYDSSGGPHGDGFHPLPHSGQICQMILEKSATPSGELAGLVFPTTNLFHGKEFFRTDLGVKFNYYEDKGGKWLGELESDGAGRAGNHPGGQFLRRFNGTTMSATNGLYIPYDITIVGASWTRDDTADIDYDIGRDGTLVTTVSVGTVEDGADFDLNVNFDGDGVMSIKTSNGSSTTVDPNIKVWWRRRAT